MFSLMYKLYRYVGYRYHVTDDFILFGLCRNFFEGTGGSHQWLWCFPACKRHKITEVWVKDHSERTSLQSFNCLSVINCPDCNLRSWCCTASSFSPSCPVITLPVCGVQCFVAFRLLMLCVWPFNSPPLPPSPTHTPLCLTLIMFVMLTDMVVKLRILQQNIFLETFLLVQYL